jgi:hypothetical protein
MKTKHTLPILAVFALLAACTPAAEPTAVHTATVAETPKPSATVTKTPRPTTNWTATAEVKATDEMAYLLELVAPDLELAGYSMDEGELGFQLEDPIKIVAELAHYRYWDYPGGFTNPVFEDFVLGVDITWDSEVGFAGCDVIFRSDGDVADGEMAEFSTERLSGAPSYWLSVINFNQNRGVIASGSSSAIDQDSHATNHYVIAVVGNEVDIFVNGAHLTRGYIKESMTRGEIVFQAWQDSGETSCTFSNAWVWELP